MEQHQRTSKNLLRKVLCLRHAHRHDVRDAHRGEVWLVFIGEMNIEERI